MSVHPTYFLPIQDVDKATEIRIKAFAVLDLLQSVDASDPNLSDDTLPGISLLLKGMVADLETIATRQR
ncbi:hypothetical protein [Thermomonas carbonis]|uniref:Uncharacterized protein n=1 Tax=Thermomonas carbonis TaxID=1463158 RepID=A0A7G9SR90_9GAMM|nr:hypothetical protein [Thermomonas carbonis]QNN70365.1 hypothetical protein H9L16_01625 [Thermomonas carbonis]GHB99534.1 hypothetical protein GCM10010080_10480 [Thermomonas carbonis]